MSNNLFSTLNKTYITLAQLKDVNTDLVRGILDNTGTLENLFGMGKAELAFHGLTHDMVSAIWKADTAFADNELKLLEKLGGEIITYESEDYPQMLKQTHSPPLYLYCMGDKSALNGICISFVGARKVSKLGEEMAFILAGELARCGITVVSGFAYGVDINAHLAAIKADGKTVAVLGSGLNRIYPTQHMKYVGELCRKGCIITEFPMNEPPNGYNFPKRNRIVSGLSYATVVVEASVRSGSLITARLALEQGRDVFAVPVSPLAANNATNILIQNGAIPVQCADDIISEYYFQLAEFLEVSKAPESREVIIDERNVTERKILELLEYDPACIDVLVEKSGEPYEDIATHVSMLEVEGIIERGTDFKYYICRKK